MKQLSWKIGSEWTREVECESWAATGMDPTEALDRYLNFFSSLFSSMGTNPEQVER